MAERVADQVFLTTTDLEKRWSVSRSTVYRWCKGMTVWRPSRSVIRVSLDEVLRFERRYLR